MSQTRTNQRQAQQSPGTSHDKESNVNTVEQQGSAPVEFVATTVATTTTAAVAAAASTAPTASVARRTFPQKPSTVKASTAYSLFSNPDAFTLDGIYSSPHYLTSSLRGKIWWDINGDGKRGSYSNSTLNTDEYDYGVPNVGNVVLVACDNDNEERIGSTNSNPYNGGRETFPLRQSLNPQSGIYEFNDLSTIPSGRYYVMYEAPRGWRLSGNVLPLGRKEMEKGGDYYYECVPEGGNGGKFGELARATGDFDYGGYCGRSIGCVEVGSRSELDAKFSSLTDLKDTDYYQDVIDIGSESGQYEPLEGQMVAMPSPHYMDVGLSQEEWDLPTRQYADATLTLQFPIQQGVESGRTLTVKTKLEELADVFANAESFGTSINQKAMEDAIHKFLADEFVDHWKNGIGKYYPHWSEDYEGCLVNDGSTPAPEYMQVAGEWYFYETLDECCEEHFGYDLVACGYGKRNEYSYGSKSEAEEFSQGDETVSLQNSAAESEAVKFADEEKSESEAENFSRGDAENKKETLPYSGSGESEAVKFSEEKSQSAKFALLGVDLFEGKIERKKKSRKKGTSDALRRYLRTWRKAQEAEDGEEVLEITYTFTARGSYRPPPHDQLGYFVEDSINADPTKLVRALREDSNLPFQELESANSNHLTVGPPAPKPCSGCVGIQATTSDGGGLKSWAKVSVVILSLMIGVLVLLFLSRRLWKRRREVDVDRESEMLTREFMVSNLDINKEKDDIRGVFDYVDEEKEGNDEDGSKKKRREKKNKLDGSERSSSSLRSRRTERSSTSDTSGLTNSLHVEDEDYLSRASDDESEAARRRRRAKKKSKRKFHGGSNRSGTSNRRGMSSSLQDEEDERSFESKGPPTLDDLRRKIKKNKRSSRRRDCSSVDS